MNKVKKLMSWNAFPALLLFVIFLGINGVMTGGLSVSFFRSFISTNAGAICVAIGVTATILVAGTDISLGSIVSLVKCGYCYCLLRRIFCTAGCIAGAVDCSSVWNVQWFCCRHHES